MTNIFKARDRFSGLRSIISNARTSEVLYTIPDRLASVIDQYDNLSLDPMFRHDVYNVIDASLTIAESIVDPTFSVETASEAIASQMEVLSRILRHLQKRPAKAGYSILIPSSRAMFGCFSTKEEASAYLAHIQATGGGREGVVVPAKVVSQHAVQPQVRQEPQQPPPDIAQGPVPAGIRPSFTVEPQPEPPVVTNEDMKNLEAEVDRLEEGVKKMYQTPVPSPTVQKGPANE